MYPALVLAMLWMAEPLGFFEQRFSSVNFERNKWSRNQEGECRGYVALENGATVEMLRIGSNNLVAFRGNKGARVVVCGTTAAFDEGFEALGSVTQPR